ncbi:hypothetical protein [Microbacterium oryzae]
MTDYRMQGGPYDGRVFDEVPDGYRATGEALALSPDSTRSRP